MCNISHISVCQQEQQEDTGGGTVEVFILSVNHSPLYKPEATAWVEVTPPKRRS